MTFNRLPLAAPVRKRARTITLTTAAIAGVALPTIASAAVVNSPQALVPTVKVAAVAPASAAASASASKAQPATAAAGSASSTSAAAATSTSTSTSTSTATAASTSAPKAASSSASTKTYTVVAGDTLYGIAQRTLGNGNDFQKIFDLNKGRSEPGGATFTSAALIKAGWTLLVPTSGSATSASATASTTAPTAAATTKAAPAPVTYADNLNGWINHAIAVLSAHGYTVSYNAIYQTAMNESSGNPSAVNGWDSNAAAGTPSIGLMQVIQPTFDAYALPGYGDIYNPVDNIISAVIYAQHTYGGLDNVVAARCGGSCWFGY